jgi:carbonic anhydrase/acetyltransferase-like protein (isoleucine patch superfamily)
VSSPASARFQAVSTGGTSAIVRGFRGAEPRIAASAWLAPGAVVVGDVEIGEDSSVWYGAVVRGDVNSIRIGVRCNIQDQATVHVTQDRFPVWIADEVTVGHRAVVHGCRVENGALIGIGAVVLDGAVIGAGALVAAGAVVTPGSVIESGMLAVGVPAKPVRRLSAEERAHQVERALAYVETARGHAQQDPLDEKRAGTGGRSIIEGDDGVKLRPR